MPGETTSQEAWPEAEPLGPTSLWQEPWWDAERRARSALRAPHPQGCGGWIRVSRRSASLLSSFLHSWLEARIVRIPASTAGILWRRSVRRAEKLVLEQQLGCGSHRENEIVRHCEERSDEAIQGRLALSAGLLRSARNDENIIRPRDSGGPSVARSAKDGGGGACGEENPDASGEASMQTPRPPRKSHSRRLRRRSLSDGGRRPPMPPSPLSRGGMKCVAV